VVIAGRVSQGIFVAEDMFNCAIIPAVMRFFPGQHVVEVKDSYIVQGVVILRQPIVNQPFIESTGVGGVGSVRKWRGGDDDEQLVGAGGEVLQDGILDVFSPADGHFSVTPGRVVGVAVKIRVGEAGFE
jgi:hypothetical protein